VRNVAPSQLTFAILAGGQGSRLGGIEKGLLRKDGQTLVERLLGLGLARADTLLISNRGAPYAAKPGVRLVPDVASAAGPGAGLVSALLAAKTKWVLLVACDQVGLTVDALAPLLVEGAEARCFRVGGRLEPFPLLCRSSLGAKFRPMLSNSPGPTQLLSSCQLTTLEATPERSAQLRSVNTEADLAELGVERPR